MSTWPALLDAIEEGLRLSPPVLVEFAPADYGPLPAALAGQATATLVRMAEVSVVLDANRAEVARELAELAAARPAPTTSSAPVPHFLDTKL